MRPCARPLSLAVITSLYLTACGAELASPTDETTAQLSTPAGDLLGNTLVAQGLRSRDDRPLCLDINGGAATLGGDLILYPCHGGANQKFSYDRASGTLQSSLGSWCVDNDHGIVASGNRVQLWGCNGTDPQTFTYDRASGALHYRPSPSWCVDLASGSARLAACDGSPGQRVSLHGRYGDRRFDELTTIATHNSFNNNEDASWIAPNQGHSIARQLDDGVRALMLDVWSFQSSTARCLATLGKDCYPKDLYMCHSDCNGPLTRGGTGP